jgi:hypothetical protein
MRHTPATEPHAVQFTDRFREYPWLRDTLHGADFDTARRTAAAV